MTEAQGHAAEPVVRDGAIESRLRARYAETDRMGVVHHAAFLVWLEIGRTDWLRAAGLSYRDLEASGLRMPVVEVSTRYHSSAHYDDELVVRTVAAELGRLRIRFDYEILRPSDDRHLASGHTAHVVCGDDNRPRRLPADVLERLRTAAGTRNG